jgi:hypothetical protein
MNRITVVSKLVLVFVFLLLLASCSQPQDEAGGVKGGQLGYGVDAETPRASEGFKIKDLGGRP